MIKLFISLLAFIGITFISCIDNVQDEVRKIDVAKVVSDFPVNFSLLTYDDMQFVAYYDTEHRLTVACRNLKDDDWKYKILNTSIGWDCHNYVTMVVDKEKNIHLSGNMHASQLIYYRTEKPLDISSFKEINYMTGRDENSATYPIFLQSEDGKLIFHYRAGHSGNGSEIFNIYDYGTKTWSRFLDVPLIDGKKMRNAYINGPIMGPDSYYHLLWVWRDTGDCSTNHHLSYARSKDMRNWESITGKCVDLPITISDTCLWVDPIPVKGGIINGASMMSFDSNNNILITYYKYDNEGNTQAYIARYESEDWNIKPLSKWNYRWEFKGGGSIGKFHVLIEPAQKVKGGKVKVEFEHIKYGKGYWIVDEKTLETLEEHITGKSSGYGPATGAEVPLEMSIRTVEDSGNNNSDFIYSLEWFTYPANRDFQRTSVKAVPSMLKVVKKRR